VPLWFAVWFVLGSQFVATLWLVYLVSKGQIVITFDKGADLATLALTAATLVITGVAVMVGIVAVWGFREIRERAVKAAVDEAIKATAATGRASFGAGRDSPTPVEADEIADAMDGGILP
jgi:hypothetical protein